MKIFTEMSTVEDPNNVKVVVDASMNSLLFSRSVIPYNRAAVPLSYYHHIGVYAFRKPPLMRFTSWPITPLEAAEKIECLRYLEHGIPLKMIVVDFKGVGIDTPQDLERAKQYYIALYANTHFYAGTNKPFTGKINRQTWPCWSKR